MQPPPSCISALYEETIPAWFRLQWEDLLYLNDLFKVKYGQILHYGHVQSSLWRWVSQPPRVLLTHAVCDEPHSLKSNCLFVCYAVRYFPNLFPRSSCVLAKVGVIYRNSVSFSSLPPRFFSPSCLWGKKKTNPFFEDGARLLPLIFRWPEFSSLWHYITSLPLPLGINPLIRTWEGKYVRAGTHILVWVSPGFHSHCLPKEISMKLVLTIDFRLEFIWVL